MYIFAVDTKKGIFMSKKSNFVLKVFSGLLALLGFSSCQIFQPNMYGVPKQEWEQKDKDINRYKVMYGGPPVDYKKMDVQATDSVKTEIPVESKK